MTEHPTRHSVETRPWLLHFLDPCRDLSRAVRLAGLAMGLRAVSPQIRSTASVRSSIENKKSLAAIVFWLIAASAVPSTPARGDGIEINRYTSRYYTIYSTTSPEEVREYGRHMDNVFKQYSIRFRSFSTRDKRSMPLYLFATRQQYLAFLNRCGIDGSGSGGMFFVRPGIEGLATFTEGRTRSSAFEVLQHEGFHQFAHAYIGSQLPVWVNEGLAEYFADGIIVRDRMKLGFANDRRTLSVRTAIQNGKAIDFDELLEMSHQQWNRNTVDQPALAGLQYDQSWSIVHFLIRGDGGKYRSAFEQYLLLVSKGRPSGSAFRMAFGTDDTSAFRRRWTRHALALKPDTFTTAVANMEFLALGLRSLHNNNLPLPATLADLRTALQRVKFRLMQSHHGVEVTIDAMDESLYNYRNRAGALVPYQILEAEADSLLPRISAPGLNPEPTLVWFRDEDELIPDVTYR